MLMADANAFFSPLDAFTLERARRGDAAAFAMLYERYKRACFNLALRVLGERGAAEDVVQDVFVRLFDAIRSFRGDAPFGAWLRRMVANATIDELRRRQWLDGDDALEQVALPASQGALAEHQVEAWQALQRLSPRARAVLVLHELEGYTHRELAELFGQSESYSKSILARAMHRLREVLLAGTESSNDGGIERAASA
jgi:RNA polymerase sigma-70 factor (ECF subfamily)